MKEYVPIFFDWMECTQDLTPEEKGNLIDAVVSYAAGMEYEHLLTGGCKIAFRFLKGQVDRNNAISDARSKARSGSKQETDENTKEQTTTNDNKTEQNESNSPKENNNNKEKEKENNNKKRFVPPTVDEVRAYCLERKNGIDPEYFVDYYTTRAWVLSNGQKMKDWRSAVRTWEHNGYSSGRKTEKTVTAQQYEQRDYVGTQDEAINLMKQMMKEAGAL